MKKINLKKISVTAMLCAVAYLCMFLFKFKVGFLTFDFKDAILCVSAFLFGPIYGMASAVVVAFAEFVSVSDTGIYGLIMNVLSSVAFSGVCGIFYKYRRTLSGAVTGCVAAVFTMTAVMLVANVFITPYYLGVSRSEVMAIIPTLLLPFNLSKGIVNAAVTMIIYKPITTAFKKSHLIESDSVKIDRKKFFWLTLCSTIAMIAIILVIIFILKGTFIFAKK
ncbi:MAG: ECF transporter S component [Ruminococcaceae bacterium]|nr:ECF transporter S component [Oscillospiraceae bacterium]